MQTENRTCFDWMANRKSQYRELKYGNDQRQLLDNKDIKKFKEKWIFMKGMIKWLEKQGIENDPKLMSRASLYINDDYNNFLRHLQAFYIDTFKKINPNSLEMIRVLPLSEHISIPLNENKL